MVGRFTRPTISTFSRLLQKVLKGILAHMYELGAFIRKHLLLLIVLILGLLVAVIWYAALHESRSGKLTIAFMNIGQGDSIYIESPTGTQVIVDGGPDGSVIRELSHLVPFYDRTIDALIVTNPDQDHFSGFVDVMDRYKVKSVFESGTKKDSGGYQALEQKITDEKADHELLRRGEVLDIGGGAYIAVLFPDRNVYGLDSNPGSLIMQLVYGKTKVMLMGDTVIPVENFVAQLDGAKLQSQILKLGHHGSRTSSGDALIAAVHPNVAIVSAGCDNKYGHPHKETLDRLASAHVPYLWTCKEGTIEFQSDGTQWVRD
jgi:competence protein ComEC